MKTQHTNYGGWNTTINNTLNRVADDIGGYPETQEQVEQRNADVRFLRECGLKFRVELLDNGNYHAMLLERSEADEPWVIMDEWEATRQRRMA